MIVRRIEIRNPGSMSLVDVLYRLHGKSFIYGMNVLSKVAHNL